MKSTFRVDQVGVAVVAVPAGSELLPSVPCERGPDRHQASVHALFWSLKNQLEF